MGSIRDAFNSAWPDGPSSNPTQPEKSVIRNVGLILEMIISSAVNGLIVGNAVIHSTRALLYANLSPSGDSLGIVYNDVNAAYDGIYVKVGASGSGSWSITGLALPSSFASDLAAVISGLAAEASARADSDASISAAIDGTGIDMTDASVKPSGLVHRAVARDDVRPYSDGTKDQSERHAIGVRDDGSVEIPQLRTVPARHRDHAGEVDSLIADRRGVLAGVERDGKLRLAISDRTRDELDYLPPTAMRGTIAAFNVRRSPKHIIGTVQGPDGYVCDVMQRRDYVKNDTAVCVERSPLEIVLYVGQSNAGYGSGAAGGPVIKALGYDNHIFALDAVASAYGGSDGRSFILPSRDAVSYREPDGYGQSPAAMFGLAACQFDRDFGRRCAGFGLSTSWEGGRPIEDFMPGAGRFIHEHAIALVTTLFSALSKYRDARLAAIVFVQGENYTADYGSALQSYIDDVVPLFSAAIGQDARPHFIFRQINAATDAVAASGVELAQVAVARGSLGSGVTLAGPMYHMPLHDGIHASDIGRMIGGEMDALAYDYAVKRGQAFNPLWPVASAAVLSGATLTIPFDLPPGSTKLAVDTGFVPATDHLGFSFSDDAGRTITNVVVNDASVDLVLSGVPTTGKKWSYALFNAPGTTGWAAGRGQLYAQTDIQSAFYRRGYAVPAKIRHYAVRAEGTVA